MDTACSTGCPLLRSPISLLPSQSDTAQVHSPHIDHTRHQAALIFIHILLCCMHVGDGALGSCRRGGSLLHPLPAAGAAELCEGHPAVGGAAGQSAEPLVCLHQPCPRWQCSAAGGCPPLAALPAPPASLLQLSSAQQVCSCIRSSLLYTSQDGGSA